MEKLGKFLNIYLLLASVFLFAGFIFLFQKINAISSNLGLVAVEPPVEVNQPVVAQREDFCGVDCQKKIDKSVAQAVATLSAALNLVQTQTPAPTKPQPVPAKLRQTVFIPLSGPITTTSVGWVDAVGAEAYIDLAVEYGKSAYLSWDAFLSVANSNGKAYARLYDVTHAIAVDGSEIYVENTSTPTQVSSGPLNLWAGRNLYRVQIKSLNSFVITFGSGRVKVSY